MEMMQKRLSNITSISLKQINRLPFKPNFIASEELSMVEDSRIRLQQRLRKRIQLEMRDGRLQQGDVLATRRLNELQTKSMHVYSAFEADFVTARFRRDVQRAIRLIYLQLLKAGKQGMDAELVRDHLQLDNSVLIEAIKKLEKLNKVQWLDDAKLKVVDNIKRYPGKIYSVYVEKILPGRALVLIDERWRARLNQYDYDGPRYLLKTGSEFKAVGDLYHQRGVLTIRIKQVVFDK
jgi:hypothetical protein